MSSTPLVHPPSPFLTSSRIEMIMSLSHDRLCHGGGGEEGEPRHNPAHSERQQAPPATARYY